MPGFTGEFISLHKWTKPINWTPCINSNCLSASTSAVSSYVATTNFTIAGIRGLQLRNNFVCGSEGRTGMVGGWVQNLHLTKGRSIISASPQLIIASDASLKGWGAFCQGHRTGGSWTFLESRCYINVLELNAAKFAILAFTQMHPSAQSIHLQMESIVTLSYLVKMGGTHNKVLSDESKEIWCYLLAKGITITAEYLPGALNKEANF